MTHAGLARIFARAMGCRLLALATTWLITAPLLSLTVQAEKVPLAVLEICGAGEWTVGEAQTGFGPSVAAEFTVIKNWLEIEPGVAVLFRGGRTDWDSDLIFRKPFSLSPTVEFEPGVGPGWSSDGKVAGVVSLHFMLWQTPEQKFGWFVEPTYSFSSGHEQAVGLTLGVLIPIR
jgi:hypothetical protein